MSQDIASGLVVDWAFDNLTAKGDGEAGRESDKTVGIFPNWVGGSWSSNSRILAILTFFPAKKQP